MKTQSITFTLLVSAAAAVAYPSTSTLLTKKATANYGFICNSKGTCNDMIINTSGCTNIPGTQVIKLADSSIAANMVVWNHANCGSGKENELSTLSNSVSGDYTVYQTPGTQSIQIV